ncbi:MAG: hypothetical protein GY862_09310 [Gammaproteobacteria bacterium]|nr:hypothetical protein [Gammaproteobacteria bacterium]
MTNEVCPQTSFVTPRNATRRGAGYFRFPVLGDSLSVDNPRGLQRFLLLILRFIAAFGTPKAQIDIFGVSGKEVKSNLCQRGFFVFNTAEKQSRKKNLAGLLGLSWRPARFPASFPKQKSLPVRSKVRFRNIRTKMFMACFLHAFSCLTTVLCCFPFANERNCHA